MKVTLSILNLDYIKKEDRKMEKATFEQLWQMCHKIPSVKCVVTKKAAVQLGFVDYTQIKPSIPI